MIDLLQASNSGIYCELGQFHIDPWKPVECAIITHTHQRNVRLGNELYICHNDSVPFLRNLIGPYAHVTALEYGEKLRLGEVDVSLHPSGHIIGASQVRIEHQGMVEVFTGDFKLQHDGISQPFEFIPCHRLIMEATFGLPFYRWSDRQTVYQEINDWWKDCREKGLHAVLICNHHGLAQEIMLHLDVNTGPVYIDSTVEKFNEMYRSLGINLPEFNIFHNSLLANESSSAFVLLPQAYIGSIKSLKNAFPNQVALANGYMTTDQNRRKYQLDRGFILSNHADWNALNHVIDTLNPQKIVVAYGHSIFFSRWLQHCGRNAVPIETDLHLEVNDMFSFV